MYVQLKLNRERFSNIELKSILATSLSALSDLLPFQASFMPVLVLAARICPQGMEATLFATLMSISNGGSVLGGLIGAGLTQVFGVTKDRFDNLAFLIILCNLSSLLPLPLLGLLPGDEPDTKDNTDIEMKSN